MCVLTTTKAIILPIKYLNGVYLVEIQWHDQNIVVIVCFAKSQLFQGTSKPQN